MEPKQLLWIVYLAVGLAHFLHASEAQTLYLKNRRTEFFSSVHSLTVSCTVRCTAAASLETLVFGMGGKMLPARHWHHLQQDMKCTTVGLVLHPKIIGLELWKVKTDGL